MDGAVISGANKPVEPHIINPSSKREGKQTALRQSSSVAGLTPLDPLKSPSRAMMLLFLHLRHLQLRDWALLTGERRIAHFFVHTGKPYTPLAVGVYCRKLIITIFTSDCLVSAPFGRSTYCRISFGSTPPFFFLASCLRPRLRLIKMD